MELMELELLLKDTKFEKFIGNISSVEAHGNIYKNLYKTGNENLGYFSLKIYENNNKYINESIKNMKIIIDKDNFINKYKDIICKDNHIIIISDWLNGFQPTIKNREYLPKFFQLLGVFNKQNIVKGPFTSMYVDYKYFDEIEDLINWEINYHKNYMQHIIEMKQIEKILEYLKKGFSCIISEDMNTGNLLITDDGKYKIIDTEWVIKGLNLYQFEKINYFGFENNEWYNITEEAKECYSIYFDALGIKNEEANDQIRAFELLQVLRTNTYNRKYLLSDNEEIIKRIKIVMDHDNFI